MISAVVFVTLVVQSLYFQNLPQAIIYGCKAWFVSDLLINAEDSFSRDTAQIITGEEVHVSISIKVFMAIPGTKYTEQKF